MVRPRQHDGLRAHSPQAGFPRGHPDGGDEGDDDEPSHRLASTVRRWIIAAPGRLTRGGRRLTVHLPRGWLWADRMVTMHARLRLMPVT